MDLSAVCEYKLEEVQRVFEGPYKEYHEQAQKWGRYTDPVPSPRPGSVSHPGQGRACVLLSSALPAGLMAPSSPPPPVHQQLAPAPRLHQFPGAARQHPQLHQEAPADGGAGGASVGPAPAGEERRQLHPAGGRPGHGARWSHLYSAVHRHRWAQGRGLGRWGLGGGLCAPGGESLLLFSLHLSSPTPPQEMAGCSRP